MEIGSVRPAVTGVTAPVPRAPAPSESSIRTDLPARAAVSEPVKAENTQLDTGSAADKRDAAASRRKLAVERRESDLDQKIEIDNETKSLVFKKIDIQSGDVVRQVPEEAMLRMRALIDAWGEGTPKGRTAAYDLTA